ncbi:MAG: tRNA dihydrouridine(20/20a) synthase DusA [Gammaproteobacteria bacterium]|nr:tRNA dihydrouridine(20/20a) synthase DusA [Gammaproteobacteria bacterium]
MPEHRLCVAPMLDWTDTHERYFLRLLSRYTLLYTEMVTSYAILKGNRQRHLHFHPNEHPVALQLGGSDPTDLAECSAIGEQFGYDEINLNVGCPSDRVKSGHFGACLMATPELVAECVDAMQQRVSIPVTVKHRIGIDDLDSYEQLQKFVRLVAEGGCQTFIVHARKAWLQGLSPKQNREIPPLNYGVVSQLKQDFPHLEFVINGGITSLKQAQQLLEGSNTATALDGVMIGREIYHNPYMLHNADQQLFNQPSPIIKRSEIVRMMIDYIDNRPSTTHVHSITRHMLGLFHEVPGAKKWRRSLSERKTFEPNWKPVLNNFADQFQQAGY